MKTLDYLHLEAGAAGKVVVSLQQLSGTPERPFPERPANTVQSCCQNTVFRIRERRRTCAASLKILPFWKAHPFISVGFSNTHPDDS